MPILSDEVAKEYRIEYITGVLLVDDYASNPDRQRHYYDFQLGFEHGCRNGIDYPEQLSKMPPLKRPVDSYTYGFRQGRRYIKRAWKTTTPMQYDKSVGEGFRRWEKNYKEG
jgi:hypothetical protein